MFFEYYKNISIISIRICPLYYKKISIISKFCFKFSLGFLKSCALVKIIFQEPTVVMRQHLQANIKFRN